MAAAKKVYQAVIGHVGEIAPGALFGSRREVANAGLHKAIQDGISWGRDSDGQVVADAIVLSKGYEDDVDQWNEILYTGAGGQDENNRQVEDQTWDKTANAALVRSQERGHCVRVIRGSNGEKPYAPAAGYRYDGLYGIREAWMEKGKLGFQICRFKLHRLPDDAQERTSLEEQVQDLIDRRPPRKSATVVRVVRNTAVVQRVKRWHDYTCQICALALAVGPDREGYAEGAHIQALGGKDGGPDVEGNVLCLCPNCHVRLDRGALYLTDDLYVVDRYAKDPADSAVPLRTVVQHRIEARFARAHRRLWRVLI
ncbi:YDG/SRA domain-containing protein [Streptomyces sp. NPDC088725]|uniref:YDG/SRA domain-containing protein n=1 Tax=Streptomyces sp. NPDC088725 TaxID=3365873 RepID=UPI00381DC30A